MGITYNLDPNPNFEDSSKRVACPICNQGSFRDADEEYTCSICKSLLCCDEKQEVHIVENHVPFNSRNLIFGILTIFASTFLIIFYNYIKGASLVITGTALFFGPFIGIFQNVYFYKSNSFQHHADLHRAVISGRIRHYDWGSKAFIVSLFMMQIVGAAIALADLIINKVL